MAIHKSLVVVNGRPRQVPSGDLLDPSTMSDKAVKYVVHPTAGVGDFTTLEAAVAAMVAPGGQIAVREGTFNIATTITIPEGCIVSIYGAGAGDENNSPVTVVNFTGSGIPLFETETGGLVISDIQFNGDNTTAQPFYHNSSGATLIVENCSINAFQQIVFAENSANATFRDTELNLASGAGDPYFWSGNDGQLTWERVRASSGVQNTTVIDDEPDFTVYDSELSGNGGISAISVDNIRFFNFDLIGASVTVQGRNTIISDCRFSDTSIKLLNNKNTIANTVFDGGGSGTGGQFDAQLILNIQAPGDMESLITNCYFISGVKGIDIIDSSRIAVTGCMFTSHSTAAIRASCSGGDMFYSVTGCRFASDTITVLEVGSSGIVGRCTANEGFEPATIIGPNTTIEGVRRNDTTSTTADAFAEVFTHRNKKGLTGVGTIKNTDGANSLDVKETAIDAFGVTGSVTNTVANGADRLLNPMINIGTARPPYVSYMIEVASTSAGNPATFESHHASNGAA